MAVASTGAAGAEAAKLRLVEGFHGPAVAPGSPASYTLVAFMNGANAFCAGEGSGSVVSNERTTDQLALPAGHGLNCSAGYAISGRIRQLLLNSNETGTAGLSSNFALTEPGPCIYRFSKLIGGFPMGLPLHFGAGASGTLQSRGSLVSCPSKSSVSFSIEVGGANESLFTEKF